MSRHLLRLLLRHLGYGESVAVRVFEPGYSGAVRCLPDAEVALCEPRKACEDNALRGKCFNGMHEIIDLPAEERVRGGLVVRHADKAEHERGCWADGEHDGEVVVFNNGEAEGGFVKGACGLGVCGGNEGDG